MPEKQGQRTVLDFSKPGLHRYTKSGLSFWSPGVVEEDSMDAYTAAYRPQPGDVVWDVGAHAGATSYFFASMVGPTGKVYAFEPDERTHDFLLRNIELHKLENVIPGEEGPCRKRPGPPYSAWTAHSGQVSPISPIAQTRQGARSRNISFGDACRQFNACSCQNGYRRRRGARRRRRSSVLKENKIHFAIETEHRINREYTWVPITRMLSGIGYSVRSRTL